MFGFLGKLIATPIKLVNVPLTILDKVADPYDTGERTVSAPLNSLAETIQEEMDELDDD